MILPPFLKPGDTIAITAPARKISKDEIDFFISEAQNKGYKVVYNSNLFDENGQFSGTDKKRAKDIQYWINKKDIQCIISARGGYGCGRIIDKINFKALKKYPKWIVGFSDITVFHSQLSNMDIASIHGAMAFSFKKEFDAEQYISYQSLWNTLSGKITPIALKNHINNRVGNAEGKLVGGNLSILYSMLGSKTQLKTKGCILLLEDLDEYLYHIDRMMLALDRAKMFKNLIGVIVGYFSDMKDNKVAFGISAEEIIMSHLEKYKFPVYFGFESGHSHPNLSLIFGLNVSIQNNVLTFATPT